MRWIGERSYSLYLVHQVIAVAAAVSLATAIASPWERLPLVLAVVLSFSLAAAAFSYRYFERPFLRRRDRDRETPRAVAWRRRLTSADGA
jgi:peptidoglycan/LPS O-acetylase OafA/YrhL